MSDLNMKVKELFDKKAMLESRVGQIFGGIQNPDFTTFQDLEITEEVIDNVRKEIEVVSAEVLELTRQLAERNREVR